MKWWLLLKRSKQILEAMRLGGFEPWVVFMNYKPANSLLTEKELGLICIVHARETELVYI